MSAVYTEAASYKRSTTKSVAPSTQAVGAWPAKQKKSAKYNKALLSINKQQKTEELISVSDIFSLVMR